jgi:hypothetical protein
MVRLLDKALKMKSFSLVQEVRDRMASELQES